MFEMKDHEMSIRIHEIAIIWYEFLAGRNDKVQCRCGGGIICCTRRSGNNKKLAGK